MIYYYAPDAEQEWIWITPGSLFATMLWLVISLGFKFYVSHFTSYNATYGTIGGVIVLMLWFYVSALAVLVGAELNAEIEHASPYGKDPGEKVAGEKKMIGAAGRARLDGTEARRHAQAGDCARTTATSTWNCLRSRPAYPACRVPATRATGFSAACSRAGGVRDLREAESRASTRLTLEVRASQLRVQYRMGAWWSRSFSVSCSSIRPLSFSRATSRGECLARSFWPSWSAAAWPCSRC